MEIVNWLPTIANGLLVCLVMYYIKVNRESILERMGRVDKHVIEVEERVKEDESRLLTEEKHDLLCRNNCLEIKAYIATVVAELQRKNQEQFEELKGLIKTNGGGK